METIKSYTNLEQSKKLAEILPLESADMWYEDVGLMIPRLGHMPKEHTDTEVPCWGLATLISVLPKSLIYTPNPTLDGYCCKNIMHDLETYGDNPVDACYEMILKLNELNLL